MTFRVLQAAAPGVRLRLLDSFTWEDDSGATRIKYIVPREEHFLIPVTIY